LAAAPERAGSQHSPIFGVTIPDGYRRWELIAPSAYREGTLPFPDGAMLAKMVKDAKKYASTGGWGSVGFSTVRPPTSRSRQRGP